MEVQTKCVPLQIFHCRFTAKMKSSRASSSHPHTHTHTHTEQHVRLKHLRTSGNIRSIRIAFYIRATRRFLQPIVLVLHDKTLSLVPCLPSAQFFPRSFPSCLETSGKSVRRFCKWGGVILGEVAVLKRSCLAVGVRSDTEIIKTKSSVWRLRFEM